MAYFRPVQAEGRPTSFSINSESGSFEKGALLFLATDGTCTSKEDRNPVLGLADDNYSVVYSTKVIGETILGSGNASSAVALAVTVTTANKPINLEGRALNADLYVTATSSVGTIQPTAVLSYRLSSAPTAAWSVAPVATSSVVWTDATAGYLLVTVPVTEFTAVETSTAYDVKLVLSYSFVNTSSLGYTGAMDMVGNDTTIASGKATVYFLPGVYETDQFDPYCAYQAGDTVYAVDSTLTGLVTSDTTSAKPIGIVVKAPSAALDASTLTVLGHENPTPNSLRILVRI